MSKVAEHAELAAAARLFGRLLVRELDEDTLAEMREPAVRASLHAVGVECPEATLDDLAAEYCARYLHPRAGFPPVQSLWTSGQYDGDSAVAVRAIAKSAALETAPGARGAAPDHLGCILILWAELVQERPDLAERLQRDHMSWAPRALAANARLDDFYGSVSAATIDLVQRLVEPVPHS